MLHLCFIVENKWKCQHEKSREISILNCFKAIISPIITGLSDNFTYEHILNVQIWRLLTDDICSSTADGIGKGMLARTKGWKIDRINGSFSDW